MDLVRVSRFKTLWSRCGPAFPSVEIRNIMVLPPSSWRQAICHRHIAFIFSNLSTAKRKKRKQQISAVKPFRVSRFETLWCCRRQAGGNRLSTGQSNLVIRISTQKKKAERANALSAFLVRVSRFELEAS